jgi:hypothetical protein
MPFPRSATQNWPNQITDDTIEPMPDGEWPTSGPLSKEENQDKEG